MDSKLVTLGAEQGAAALPALFTPDPAAARRTVEFFTANIRNPNTRKAYARATADFAAWCDARGLHELRKIQPVHVAAYVETLQARLAAPSVKQHLAALRMLFDGLVGQVTRYASGATRRLADPTGCLVSQDLADFQRCTGRSTQALVALDRFINY